MELNTIAVIGAGTMGRGIACVAVVAGYRTILEDVSAEMLEKSTAYIRQALDEGIARLVGTIVRRHRYRSGDRAAARRRA